MSTTDDELVIVPHRRCVSEFGGNWFRNRLWRYLYSVTPFVFLSACVPSVSTYYEPRGSGEIVGAAACTTLLYKTMRFDLGNNNYLTIGALVPTVASPKSRLNISIDLHPLHIVRFPAASVILRTSDSEPALRIPIDAFQVVYLVASPDGGPPHITSQSAVEPLDGGHPGVGSIPRQTEFGTELQLPLSSPRDFSIELPEFFVDNRRVRISPVHFTVQRGAKITGLLCE